MGHKIERPRQRANAVNPGPNRYEGAAVDQRTCKKCGEAKPATAEFFNRHAGCKDGLRSECRECHKTRMRSYYQANSAERRAKTAEYAAVNAERVREYRRRYREHRGEALAASNRAATLMREYGLTPEAYMDLFVAQDGHCAICLAEPKTRRLCVDHDHETGAVRGLLCPPCNAALGRFGDNEAGVLRVLNYLRNTQELAVPGPLHLRHEH